MKNTVHTSHSCKNMSHEVIPQSTHADDPAAQSAGIVIICTCIFTRTCEHVQSTHAYSHHVRMRTPSMFACVLPLCSHANLLHVRMRTSIMFTCELPTCSHANFHHVRMRTFVHSHDHDFHRLSCMLLQACRSPSYSHDMWWTVRRVWNDL